MNEQISHVDMQRELEEAIELVDFRDKPPTETEMIEKAKEIAFVCGWVWLEPAQVVPNKSWLDSEVGSYQVKSNANERFWHVIVNFDAKKGTVLSANFNQR